MSSKKVHCNNCDFVGSEDHIRPLMELPNLYARLTPGHEIPVGECRKCGTFCYLGPRKLLKSFVVQELSQAAYDSLDLKDFRNVLITGCPGYENMTNEELEQEWNDLHCEEIKIEEDKEKPNDS